MLVICLLVRLSAWGLVIRTSRHFSNSSLHLPLPPAPGLDCTDSVIPSPPLRTGSCLGGEIGSIQTWWPWWPHISQSHMCSKDFICSQNWCFEKLSNDPRSQKILKPDTFYTWKYGNVICYLPNILVSRYFNQ